MARLELSFNKEFNRFVLRDAYQRDSDGVASYEMVIEYEGDNEYNYRFLIWEEGEWSEIIKHSDFKQRLQDVKDNEGDRVATIWEQEHTYFIVRDDHRVFELQRKWEAMMELGLFSIPSQWDTWQGRPMSEEAQWRMAEARDQEMKEMVEEMDKEYERQAEAKKAAQPIDWGEDRAAETMAYITKRQEMDDNP